MLSMKSVASALVLVASAADVAVPVLVAPALVLAGSTAVRAQESGQAIRQQLVRYGDLNLAAPAGQAALQSRVKSAVQSVCGPEADMRDFHEARDYAACVAKASHDAMGAVPKVRQQASQPAAHAG
jgi:UrcA family protein